MTRLLLPLPTRKCSFLPPIPIHIRVMGNRGRTFAACPGTIRETIWKARRHRGSWSVAVEKEEGQEDGATSRTEDPTGNLPPAWTHEPAMREAPSADSATLDVGHFQVFEEIQRNTSFLPENSRSLSVAPRGLTVAAAARSPLAPAEGEVLEGVAEEALPRPAWGPVR
ncbi:hypothetical protein NDU88_009981 [Pleurodeles waltl]|uniref:Uncharacterized protein n=1 Tax=Pleurodeles waltl TaxID=8319 RepID=A0AAV7RWS3_PLEWA|nr:hypothetical protein NDU88_009981 [Pleurodeles waltl]